MSGRVCGLCEWDQIPISALACVRCGEPRSRGRGLVSATFSATTGPALVSAFSRSRILSGEDGGVARPVAWTGFGDTAALLTADDAAMTLERLDLSAAADAAAPWLSREVLARHLPIDLLDSLVAPPLASRTGIALITDREIRFFPHDESRTPGLAETTVWPAESVGEKISAAAISPSGDIYVATVDAGGAVTVRGVDGQPVAAFAGPGVAADSRLGFAVQGRAGDATLYVWRGGRIAWIQVAGSRTSPESEIELPGLEGAASIWRRRLIDNPAAAWHGWRVAAGGVYPVALTGGEQPSLGTLVTGLGAPSLVRYGFSCPQGLAGGPAQTLLVSDTIGLKVYNARTGALTAEREGALPDDSVFAALSSGTFLSLVTQGSGEIVLSAWSVRQGELVRNCTAQLQAPRSADAPGVWTSPLRAVAELEPIELDEGLALAFEEGAGESARLRLWCEASAFGTEARAG